MNSKKNSEIRLVRNNEDKKIIASDKFRKYLGYKFYFVDTNDQVDLIRIVSLYKDSPYALVKRRGEANAVKMDMNEIAEKYTPLSPKGFIMFSHVVTKDSKGLACPDVIVSLYDMIHVKMGENIPSAVCRQSINDFFYYMIMNDPTKINIAGVSVSRENCPANINYECLMACDEVIHTDMVNFYLDDTIDDILDCLVTETYDKVLRKLFKDHLTACGRSASEIKNFKYPSTDGWCRDLKTLLTENNFISDIDSIRNTTALQFDLEEFLVKEGEDVYSFNSIMLDFFNYVYRINAVKTMVIKYDYDINLGEFNNSNYIFFRDSNNVTWLVVYTCEGEYIEKELEEKFNELGVADKLRLAFYDKYHN